MSSLKEATAEAWPTKAAFTVAEVGKAEEKEEDEEGGPGL